MIFFVSGAVRGFEGLGLKLWVSVILTLGFKVKALRASRALRALGFRALRALRALRSKGFRGLRA